MSFTAEEPRKAGGSRAGGCGAEPEIEARLDRFLSRLAEEGAELRPSKRPRAGRQMTIRSWPAIRALDHAPDDALRLEIARAAETDAKAESEVAIVIGARDAAGPWRPIAPMVEGRRTRTRERGFAVIRRRFKGTLRTRFAVPGWPDEAARLLVAVLVLTPERRWTSPAPRS